MTTLLNNKAIKMK